MKKIISAVAALTVILTTGISAFAQVMTQDEYNSYVNGNDSAQTNSQYDPFTDNNGANPSSETSSNDIWDNTHTVYTGYAMMQDFFVNDYANVINDQTRSDIVYIGTALEKKTGVQVVTAVVPSLEGNDIRQFAYMLAEDWKIGTREDNNGILVVLSLADRQCSIEVGYGIEEYLTDAQSGKIIDKYMIPYFSQRDGWSEGLLQGYKEIANTIYKAYDIVPDQALNPQKAQSESQLTVAGVVGFIVAAAVMILVVSKVFKRSPYLRMFLPQIYTYKIYNDFSNMANSQRIRGLSQARPGVPRAGGGGSFGGGGASRKF